MSRIPKHILWCGVGLLLLAHASPLWAKEKIVGVLISREIVRSTWRVLET